MGLVLLLQWAWIVMAALQSLRQRVRTTQLKLDRELAAFCEELSASGLGSGDPLRAEIHVLQRAVSDVFARQEAVDLRDVLLGIRAFMARRPRMKEMELETVGFGESANAVSETPQLRERWDWVELALWDFLQGVREYRIRWNSLGTSVLGKALGYQPVREDLEGLESPNLP